MKNSFIVIIVLILFSGCSMQKKLSSQLYQIQKQECGDYQYLKSLKKNRNDANIFNSFDLRNDTLYIIESYDNDLQTGIITMSVTYWSKNKKKSESLYIRENNNKLTKTNGEFNRYIMHLVNSWDIEKIKLESEQFALIPTFIVYASRIFFINSNPQIETNCFDYFWNIKAEEEFYK